MGYYPTPPAKLIPYDVDGSVVLRYDGSQNVTIEGAAFKTRLISFNQTAMHYGTGYSGFAGWVYIFFPRPMDLTHYAIAYAGNGLSSFQLSTDAVDYDIGTWTAAIALTNSGTGDIAARTIRPFGPHNNIKAVRFWSSPASGNAHPLYSVQLFGLPSTLNHDELLAWDAVLDQPMDPANFDFEDNYEGSTAGPKLFRVKNLSTTKTATAPSIGTQILDNRTPSIVNATEFSIDGGSTWATTVTLPDLAPEEVSGEVQIRHNIDPAPQFGVYQWRVTMSSPSLA